MRIWIHLVILKRLEKNVITLSMRALGDVSLKALYMDRTSFLEKWVSSTTFNKISLLTWFHILFKKQPIRNGQCHRMVTYGNLLQVLSLHRGSRHLVVLDGVFPHENLAACGNFPVHLSRFELRPQPIPLSDIAWGMYPCLSFFFPSLVLNSVFKNYS